MTRDVEDMGWELADRTQVAPRTGVMSGPCDQLSDFVLCADRSLDELGTNYVCKENSDALSACVLSFASDGIGRRMSQMCVDEILNSFSGDWANHNGQDLIMRVLKKVCGVDKVSTTALTAKMAVKLRAWLECEGPCIASFPYRLVHMKHSMSMKTTAKFETLPASEMKSSNLLEC
jgi:hypothetical protein